MIISITCFTRRLCLTHPSRLKVFDYAISNRTNLGPKHYGSDSSRSGYSSGKNTPPYLHHVFGPPDPTSNIRPLKLPLGSNESPLVKRYRRLCEETWVWVDNYWRIRNIKYAKEKAAFNKTTNCTTGCDDTSLLDASRQPDLSDFHRKFLLENRAAQIKFNLEWYQRIARIVCLSIAVDMQRLIQRISRRPLT